MKDEKSAAQFHYVKTVSGKVVAQSIAFGVVSIYWQVVALFPWYLNAKGPTPIGSTCVAHTSPHSAAAVRDIEKSLITANMQSKTGFPSSHQLKSYVTPETCLKLAACCFVRECCSSCLLTHRVETHTSNQCEQVQMMYWIVAFIIMILSDLHFQCNFSTQLCST